MDKKGVYSISAVLHAPHFWQVVNADTRPVNSPGFSVSLTDFGPISRPNSYVSKTKKLDTVLNLMDFNISMLTGL